MVTLEQVDQLRKRTNCSYEEAKVLLEKHNGDVLEAIVDFEKGKHNRNYSSKSGCCGDAFREGHSGEFWAKAKELFHKSLESQLVIEDKGGIILLKIPVIAMVFLLIFVWYITIPILLLLVFLGYKIAIRKARGEEVNISSMVRDAADKFTGKDQPQNYQNTPVQKTEAEKKDSDYNEITID